MKLEYIDNYIYKMEDELDKSRKPCPRLRDFSRSWSSSLLTICPGLNLSDSTALHEGTISRYRELCRKLPSIGTKLAQYKPLL